MHTEFPTIREVVSLARQRGITSSDLKAIYLSALSLNISNICQSLIREGYLHGIDFQINSLVAGPCVDIAAQTEFPFSRVRINYASKAVIPQNNSTISAKAFLNSLRLALINQITDAEWHILRTCFLSSLSHLTINLILARKLTATSIAVERNPLGHNLYPFPALKMGLSISDATSVTNLCAQPLKLPFISCSYVAFQSNIFDTISHCLNTVIGHEAFDHDMHILPIHPWQLKHSNEIKTSLGRTLALEQFATEVVPLSSLRTFRHLRTRYDIKLSANIILTSECRLIYQMHCQNALAISTVIKHIAKNDLLLQNLVCQHTIATASFPDFYIAPHLSMILREPIHLHNGREVVVATDLWYGPQRIKEFLVDSDLNYIKQFWHEYCSVVIKGVLLLLIRHGIALEPHLQNCYIVFQESRPIQIIIRDLESAILEKKIVDPMFKNLRLQIFPNTWDLMAPYEQGVYRLIHALFHAHLSEAMLYFTAEHGVNIDCLYKIMIDVIYEHQSLFTSRLERVQFALLTNNLFKIKSLLRMCLSKSESFLFN